MTIKLPPVLEIEKFSFDMLCDTLDKNVEKLKIGSNKKPSTFNKDISFFKREWLSLRNNTALNSTQLKSVGIYLLESKESTKRLLQDKDNFYSFIKLLVESDSIGDKKRLVQLYFQYYQLFQTNKVDIKPNIIKMLKNFDGKNLLLKEYKEYRDTLFIPKEIMKQYDFKSIVKKFFISSSSEYYKALIILSLIKKVESLPIGKYDRELFEEIKQYKDYPYDNNIHIGEYVVRLLILRMMEFKANNFDKWISFIIELLGDPRSVSVPSKHYIPWSRVGEKYKEYLIRYLSREDLELFLDVLGDSDYNIDAIYQYRKKFWKNFAKYVQFTKLFVNNHKYQQLPHNIQKRFNIHNSAYGKISDSKRSFIYMDLGEIKVIEGTHNAKVRLYTKSPIDLEKHYFEYKDFYSTRKAIEALVLNGEITHSHSESGSWQGRVLDRIREHKSVDIRLSDVY